MKCWICGDELRDKERTVVIDLGEHISIGDAFHFRARIMEVHLQCVEDVDPSRLVESIRGRLRDRVKEVFRRIF